jgi:nucleotide-binding universal stress UspA family protein
MPGKVDGILVGYDGSPGGEQALRWAAWEARARGTVLTVCHAWSPGYLAWPGDLAAASRLARRGGDRVLAHGLRIARGLLDAGQVCPLLASGPAAAVLCGLSAESDLVVVGSRGHSRLSSLLLGSVSSQTAAHARGPVVVVPGHWRKPAGPVTGPVMVGVDGSRPCEAALALAFQEARVHHARVMAVCAPADAPGVAREASRIQEEFEHVVDTWQKECPDVMVQRRISQGPARAILLDAASEAQLLVIGSRGRGGVRGMALGSVSQSLLHHAPCPVCVAHPHRPLSSPAPRNASDRCPVRG